MSSRSDEHIAERPEDYEVVGATLVAQDSELPLRLRPILRSRHQSNRYALLRDDGEGDFTWDVGPEETWSFQPEDAGAIQEGAEQGRFHLFPFSFPVRTGHWLVQMRPRVLPEYLPAEEARRRLQEEGERALGASAAALGSDAYQDAVSHAAYASRALPHDPLPRLALIALLRPCSTDSQLWLKAHPLCAFTDEEIQERFAQARGDHTLASIVARILSDPLADEHDLTPTWFPKDPVSPRHLRRRTPGACWELRKTA